MARASTVTWLSLDRFAAIMGIDPLHFNQVYTTLRPNTTCSELWYQYAWQGNGKVSREDLAMAIKQAEEMVRDYVGYNLLPDWTADERKRTIAPYRPELINTYGRNTRGMMKTITTDRAWVISGGTKQKTLITAAVIGAASDDDSDGYAETLTFTVTTTTDVCEIRAYHSGYAGADEWEIRPITVTAGALNAKTIEFKIWQLVDPSLWEGLGATGISGDTAANFQQCTVVTPQFCIDVYRVYNHAETQVEFGWYEPNCSSCGGSGCTVCQIGAQDGCLTTRDKRLGIVSYEPGTWDATTSTFASGTWSECREPDRLRMWYYSGWQYPGVACPERDMDPYWERVVAYLATAILARPLCNCDCHSARFDYWQTDLALNESSGSFQNAAAVLENPFGTTRGAVFAWRAVNAEGRKVARW